MPTLISTLSSVVVLSIACGWGHTAVLVAKSASSSADLGALSGDFRDFSQLNLGIATADKSSSTKVRTFTKSQMYARGDVDALFATFMNTVGFDHTAAQPLRCSLCDCVGFGVAPIALDWIAANQSHSRRQPEEFGVRC